MSTKKQIVLNVFSNYAGRGFGMLLGFFLVPFLIAKLGVEAFGLIVVFESLMKLVETVSTSVRVALARYATFALSQGRQDDLVSYLSTGRGIFLVLSAFIAVLGFVLSFWIPELLRLPAGRHHECQQYFALICLAFAVTVPNIVYWSGLYAAQRFDLINLSNSAGLTLRALAVFAVFSVVPQEHLNLVTYGAIYLVMTWSQNFAVYLAFHRLMPGLKVRLRHFQREKVREILSFSAYTLSSNMSAVIRDGASNILINLFWGPAANALYGIGCKFALLIESIVLEPTWTLTPAFTEFVAKGEREKLKTLLFTFTRAMSVLCLPMLFALIFFAQPILTRWVGGDFGPAAVIMTLSLLPQCVYIPTASTHNLPNAFGKMKVPGIVNPIYDLGLVSLSYFFAVPLGLGLTGMALGNSVCSALMALLFAVPYGCHVAGFSAAEYWLKAYLKPAAWALLVWLPVLYFLRGWQPMFWEHASSLAALGLSAAVYGAGVWFLVLDGRDKRYLGEFAALRFFMYNKGKNATEEVRS